MHDWKVLDLIKIISLKLKVVALVIKPLNELIVAVKYQQCYLIVGALRP